ncbi:MAG TPA: alpha/beta fold hydrolase [Candidatus Methylomirabilis sp.]|nr:alpha/beta fold hydrolase [Candidatus Methylomirabilis sp.]
MTPPVRTMAWRVPLLLAGILGTSMLLGLERYLIYIPERTLEMTPRSEGLAYQDIRFPASDGLKLHGWLIPAPNARVTLVWFHGNAGNISHRVDNIKQLHRFLNRSLIPNIFIFDYRGYGQSEGGVSDLSEEATYRDAEGALTYLRTRQDLAPTKIVYFGRSLGAAIAVEAARRQPPAGLILETPFTSIRDMAKVALPFLPVWGLVRTKYDAQVKIRDVRVPLLILHGDQDDVVPYEQGRRLFEAANEPKTLYTIPGARHNDTYIVGNRPYFAAWARFLEGL